MTWTILFIMDTIKIIINSKIPWQPPNRNKLLTILTIKIILISTNSNSRKQIWINRTQISFWYHLILLLYQIRQMGRCLLSQRLLDKWDRIINVLILFNKHLTQQTMLNKFQTCIWFLCLLKQDINNMDSITLLTRWILRIAKYKTLYHLLHNYHLNKMKSRMTSKNHLNQIKIEKIIILIEIGKNEANDGSSVSYYSIWYHHKYNIPLKYFPEITKSMINWIE